MRRTPARRMRSKSYAFITAAARSTRSIEPHPLRANDLPVTHCFGCFRVLFTRTAECGTKARFARRSHASPACFLIRYFFAASHGDGWSLRRRAAHHTSARGRSTGPWAPCCTRSTRCRGAMCPPRAPRPRRLPLQREQLRRTARRLLPRRVRIAVVVDGDGGGWPHHRH